MRGRRGGFGLTTSQLIGFLIAIFLCVLILIFYLFFNGEVPHVAEFIKNLRVFGGGGNLG